MQTLNHSVTLLAQRLLLIEDNYDDAELMAEHLDVLKQAGMSFEHCDCLAAGLSRLEKDDVDIILLDLSLPDSTGISTVTKIHQAAPSIPLIVLTGTDDNDMAMQALRCGAQDYLIKGRIDMPSLCRSISYSILRHQAAATAERLAAIVETSDDSIIGKTLKGTITSWNGGAERLYGYSQAEALGKSVAMLIPPTSPDELGKILESLTNGETIHSHETVRIAKDGHKVDVSVTISPIKQFDGTVTGAAAIARDITQRKRAEREMKDVEQRLSLALKAGDVGVWDVTLASGTVWRSLRHDEIFGHHSPDWSFDTFLSYVLPKDSAYVAGVFAHAHDTDHFDLECRIIRADGVLRWIAVRGETLKDAAGTPIRMMGTMTDITDRKEQEEQRRLVSVMEAREDFMATLTHDMKNPLIGANRLLGLFVTEQLGKLTSEQLELLQCLMESNTGVLNLIRNLIDVYRWEKDVNSLSLVNVDLIVLVHDCVKHTTPLAKLRGIEIVVELPMEMDVVQADAMGVQRILMNLLDNALKFTPANGSIIIRLFPLGDYAAFEVEDKGPGIKPEEMDRLFKRFSQGAVGKRYTGGSGLGLYLCKQIAEAHGGVIECKSKSDEATTFRVSLPFQKRQQQITGALPTCIAPSLNCHPDVLIIEDDAILNKVMSLEFTLMGMSVQSAQSGTAALLMIKESLPSIIILDVVLPDMTGYELVEELCRNPETRTLPLIVHTVLSLSTAQQAQIKLGHTRFVTKSTGCDDVLAQLVMELSTELNSAKAVKH